ncbi:hypothetical protein OY671_004558, partial [Metschnikowia pulcherrima]
AAGPVSLAAGSGSPPVHAASAVARASVTASAAARRRGPLRRAREPGRGVEEGLPDGSSWRAAEKVTKAIDRWSVSGRPPRDRRTGFPR